MTVSAFEICKLLDGEIIGDPLVEVSGPSKLDDSQSGTVSFLANEKYEQYLYSTKASVVLVDKKFIPNGQVAPTLIKVADVYAALTKLMHKFGASSNGVPKGMSDLAFVHKESTIDNTASLGAFSVIGKGSSVGADTHIYSQVFIGENVNIGKHVIIYPGVKIYNNSVIGDYCIVHANAVIGSDGFGYATTESGYEKIMHLGNVVLEDNVEIGANTVIDRASMGSTIIRKGVKLDNLVQIAHNVEVGQNTVIAAQAGIAGSTKIGEECKIGGQAGFVGHISIANGTSVQAQSGVARNIKTENSRIYGYPAIDYREYLKSFAIFKQLPLLRKKIETLEAQLDELKEK